MPAFAGMTGNCLPQDLNLLAVFVDGDIDEAAFGDFEFFAAFHAVDYRVYLDCDAAGAYFLDVRIALQTVADKDGQVELDIVHRHGHDAGFGELAGRNGTGQIHHAQDPAAEHVAVGIGVLGQCDYTYGGFGHGF